MKKLLSFVATFSLLTNTLLAPVSILAQNVDESPTPTPVGETIESSVVPEETITPDPTEIAAPTPEATLAPVDVVSTEPVIEETSQPTETQAPESTPTVQGPPEASATPTIAPESSEENIQLNAVILENEKIETSVLDNFDLDYTEDGSASISTDKLDYSPTDTAVVSGTGFISEKTYTITITSSDEPAVDFKDTLTANDKGEVLYSYTLDGTYRPNYQVKILDGDRVVAETTFTDSASASISGTVFNDLDNDGSRDGHWWFIWWTWDELGIQGVTINLDKTPYGSIDKTTTTDANGDYSFNNLSAGNYQVRQTTPTGYVQTTINPSDIHINDWNHVTDIDFGNHLQPATPPTITIVNPTTAPAQSKTVTASTSSGTLTMSITTGLACNSTSGLIFESYSDKTFALESDNGKKICYKAVGSGGTTYLMSATIAGIDRTPPVISSHEDITAEATTSAGAVVTYTSPSTDTSGVATCLPASGGTFPIGDTTITCNATDIAGNIAISTTFIIHVVDTTIPSVPTGGQPDDVSIPTNNFDFTWGSSTDASPITYEFQSSLNSAQTGGVLTTDLWHSGVLPSAMIHSSGAPDGKWNWQVRATDSYGNTSAWSEIWSVTIDTTPPVITIDPYNMNPTNQDITVTAHTDEGTLNENSHTFTSNGSFTFVAIDDVGNTTSQTVTITNIDKIPPRAPILQSPADGAYVQGMSLTNSWSTVIDASKYIYESYNDADAISLRWHQEISAPATSKTATNVSEAVFWWRVKAVDAAGNESAWSPTWKVTVDNTAPVLSSQTSFNGWYNTNRVSEFTYIDVSGSSITGVPVSCTINTEGANQTCNVTPNVCDEAGNCNTTTVTSNPANIDKTNPIVEIVSPLNGLNIRGIVELKGNITENNLWRYYYQIKRVATGTVVASNTVYSPSLSNQTFYSWNTTTWPDGEYNIQLAARDLANNRGSESEDFVTVVVDNTPADISVEYSTKDWTNADVVATASTSEDGSFINEGGNAHTFTENGEFVFTFEDLAGNQSSVTAVVDNIDKVNPHGSWVSPIENATVSGVITLNFNAQDNLSGVANVAYKYKAVGETDFRTDGNVVGNSWDTTGLSLGDYIVRAEITDNAGNVAYFDITVGVAALISDQNAIGVSTTSIAITWTTDRPTTSRVVYDTIPHSTLGAGDNYGYAFSTTEDTNKVTSHSVTITGLSTGTTYYYRVISHGSPTAVGGEGYAITLTNAGPPESSGGTTTGGVLGTTTGGLLAGTFHQLAFTTGGEEGTGNATVETGSGHINPEPEVLGAETSSRAGGLLGWVRGHMGLSLGIIVILSIIILAFLRRRKNKNS